VSGSHHRISAATTTGAAPIEAVSGAGFAGYGHRDDDLYKRIALEGRRIVTDFVSAAGHDAAERGAWLRAVEARIAQIAGDIARSDETASSRAPARGAGADFSPPRIAVILPTFNRARFVTEAIASVLDQTLARWELIVVDDGSADDTAAAVAPYLRDPRIRYFRREHAGQSAARNHGLREARAPVVAFLDSDNLYFPGFLDAAAAAFEDRPYMDVAYGILATRYHALADTELLFRPFDRGALCADNYVDVNSFICRKAAIDRVGGFDELLETHEDWDLLLRLTVDKPACPLPILSAYYRVVDTIRLTDTVRREPFVARIKSKIASSR
jgi:hypothetical protein